MSRSSEIRPAARPKRVLFASSSAASKSCNADDLQQRPEHLFVLARVDRGHVNQPGGHEGRPDRGRFASRMATPPVRSHSACERKDGVGRMRRYQAAR